MSDAPLAVSNPAEARILRGLTEIAPRYDLLLCDVWGVLHDGIRAFAAAGEALGTFRAGGGRVILVSNAPRPGSVVARHLAKLGVVRDAYDEIRTSGDLTRQIVEEHGARLFHHIGPERDLGLFQNLAARHGGLEEADYVVCTGLFDDETETVADYETTLARMRERDLLMVCANPDIVVERGHLLILCAGALAAAYEEIGGRTLTPGKPHPPIYEAALALGDDLFGRGLDRRRVLAIGDAIRTDIAGGHGAGLDTLLVARGIHAAELGSTAGRVDAALARVWLNDQSCRPTWLMHELVWSQTP